jgi:hypothetical protein
MQHMYKPNSDLRVNPGGILAPGQVVGRDKFIEAIWRKLDKQSVLLSSERRMGKTSVMSKMAEEAPGRRCPIRRSLQGINTPEEFARALVADVESNLPDVLSRPILKRLRKAGVKKVGVKSVEVEFEPVSEEAWKSVVVETFETIDAGLDERAIFLWDEVPHMVAAIESKRDATTARDMLDILRYVRETYPSTSMVLSGSLGIHHVVDKLRLQGGMWAPTNDVAMIDVPPLDRPAAVYLAAELLRNEGISCDDLDSVSEAIASEVDCVPYYVHHTVAQLQHRQERGDGPVNSDVVRQTIEENLVDPQDPWQFKHYVDRVPVYYPQEKDLALAVLDILAETEAPRSQAEIENLLAARMQPPDESRLHNLLELLGKDHYIEPGYRFRLELVRRAWRSRRPPL